MELYYASCVVAALVIAFLPTGSAGTEDEPEVIDALDDVEYDDKYVGTKDHAWLDIVAVWFSYDNGTDEVVTSFKVANAEAMSDPPADWVIRCSIYGDVVADEEIKGRLQFAALKRSDQSQFESSVEFDANPGETIQGFNAHEELAHSYEMAAVEPGFHIFRIDRSLIQQLADQVQDLRADCYEEYGPVGPVGLYRNADVAFSEAVYSFDELRPLRASNGDELPAGMEPGDPNSSKRDEPPASSPGPSPPVVVLGIGIGLAIVGSIRTPRIR